MGCIYRRKNKLWIRFKGADGKWTQDRTPYHVGQEAGAKKLLAAVEARIAAGEPFEESKLGPVTVRRYAKAWMDRRKKLGGGDGKNDEQRLRRHIFPIIGNLPIEEVRPRHIIAVIDRMRSVFVLSKQTGTMVPRYAPKTVRNVYSVMKSLFRDAQVDELVQSSPCILTKRHLGEMCDKDPEWRASAIYERDEVELLISDPRVPPDRRVLYAIEVLAGARYGEVAGLRWRNYLPDMKPLGRLLIPRSYGKAGTKTHVPKEAPVHPTLAAILAEWKLSGWPAMMGRAPGPDDLIVPLPAGLRTKAGTMRDKNRGYKAITADLATLGLRHRRGHDLRRTMISLARADGARTEVLERITHRRKGSVMMDVYTEFPWEVKCAEIMKLNVRRRPATYPEPSTADYATGTPAGEPRESTG